MGAEGAGGGGCLVRFAICRKGRNIKSKTTTKLTTTTTREREEGVGAMH